MEDLRQSPAWANYLKSIGWKVEKRDGVFIYIKQIPVIGNFVKIQRADISSKSIKMIIDKYNPFQILYEPLKKVDLFEISKSPSLPTKTLQINLSKSEDYLLKSFAQKTRYNIKQAVKGGVEIKDSKDIYEFSLFWRENFERRRFIFLSQQKNIIALHRAFGKDAHIFIANKKDEVIAVLLILIYDKVAYYMYAAANSEGRKNYAPTLLTWGAIRYAKRQNCQIFDFDGIYDERFPIKTWLGFTKFKKGFRGREILYPGSFVKNKFTNIMKHE